MERLQRLAAQLQTAVPLLPPTAPAAAAPAAAAAPLRVCLIGDSEAGGYGHGLELLFVGRSDGVVVAMSDPHPEPRADVAAKIGDPKQYDDWREMIIREKPELVVIAVRWSEEHYEMAHAALTAGAHIFMEKPFLHRLDQADELIALADNKGLQFNVKHGACANRPPERPEGSDAYPPARAPSVSSGSRLLTRAALRGRDAAVAQPPLAEGAARRGPPRWPPAPDRCIRQDGQTRRVSAPPLGRCL